MFNTCTFTRMKTKLLTVKFTEKGKIEREKEHKVTTKASFDLLVNYFLGLMYGRLTLNKARFEIRFTQTDEHRYISTETTQDSSSEVNLVLNMLQMYSPVGTDL